MHNRKLPILFLGCAALLLSGCPKGNDELKAGRQAEALQDYDTALVHYERALRADPMNSEYKLKAQRLRFEAANYHVNQGQKLRDKGALDQALAEFEKAAAIDPSNAIAAQEAQRTLEMLGARNNANAPAPPPSVPRPKLTEGPPKLMPIPNARVSLKMTNQARTIFETIGKLSGLTVIFDPDFLQANQRTISVDLPNVSYTEALDIAALQSKAFWKPVTSNIILVAADDPNKRKAFEEEVVKVFYLSNVTADKDLTDMITAIRNLFSPALQRINPIPSQNAIVIRDTPDKVMLVGKMIDALDKAKPEVVIQVSIIEVNRDRLRDLGLQPSFSASGGIGSINFNPPAGTTSTSSGTGSTATSTTSGGLPLNQFKHFSTGFYSATLPNITVEAMMTDSATKIIQNPELRAVDGTKAQLLIGDRIPIATGSFGTGFGAGGVGAGASSVLSPLVNTQFQYQNVGVNIDVTPRILPYRDVFMALKVEVSSVTGNVNIGGITQPIISQRVLDDPGVRLKDGEVNILGGIIERTDTNSINGYPGLARIPILRYLFGGTTAENKDDEVLIVLTPHVVRMPDITADDLRSIASGTDLNPQVHVIEEGAPAANTQTQQPPAQATSQILPGVAVIANGPTVTNPPPATLPTPGAVPTLRFQPGTLTLKPGETSTVGIVVENVTDLASIPLLLQYNPAVISVEEIRHGGFLSSDSQESIVQRIDQPHGQAIISATRAPNTPGVNGTGTVVGVVIKALAPGDSKLSIVQVNAKDSAQKAIQLITTEGTIHVQQ